MLVDLYGHPDAARRGAPPDHLGDDRGRARRRSSRCSEGSAPSCSATSASLQDVLHRYGPEPDVLLRSMTGDNLLRVFADTVARAGATTYAGPLLPGPAAVRRTAQRRRRPQCRPAGRRRPRPPRRARRRPRVPPSVITRGRRGAGPVDAVAAAAGPLPRPPGRRRRTRRRQRRTSRRALRAEAQALARDLRRPPAGAGRPAPPAGSADPSVTASMRRDGPTWVLRHTARPRPVARQQRPGPARPAAGRTRASR